MATKYEINLNQLVDVSVFSAQAAFVWQSNLNEASFQNFKNAVTAYKTEELSALFFGDESSKRVTNVFFVPKDAEKIENALVTLKRILPSSVKPFGCDNPANSRATKWTNIKWTAAQLKTMSAQKLSSRITGVKHIETLSAPSGNLQCRVAANFELNDGASIDEQIADLKEQLSKPDLAISSDKDAQGILQAGELSTKRDATQTKKDAASLIFIKS